MSFPESITKQIRRRSHFQCCLCKALGVEIHHIVPQAEGGKDTEANAAPLCPTCHETYGANPIKRKFIREARDLWFEICEKRYASDSSILSEVRNAVAETASKEDLSALRADIATVLSRFGPRGTQRAVSIPRKQHDRSIRDRLDARDYMVLLFGTPKDRPLSQTELLCLREFWPMKRGYRKIYNEFREKFGSRSLRMLAARSLDEDKIPVRQGLTEQEIENALHLMSVEAVLLLSLEDEQLIASLRKDGQILWQASASDEP